MVHNGSPPKNMLPSSDDEQEATGKTPTPTRQRRKRGAAQTDEAEEEEACEDAPLEDEDEDEDKARMVRGDSVVGFLRLLSWYSILWNRFLVGMLQGKPNVNGMV